MQREDQRKMSPEMIISILALAVAVIFYALWLVSNVYAQDASPAVLRANTPSSAADWLAYLLPVLLAQLAPVVSNLYQRWVGELPGAWKAVITSLAAAIISALSSSAIGGLDTLTASILGTSMAAANHVSHSATVQAPVTGSEKVATPLK